MENFADLFEFVLNIILDVVQLGMIVAALLIVARSIYGMVQNKTAAWDNLLFVPIVLFLGAAMLQYYPPLLMKSARIGVQGSRAEADLLRNEMREWVPDLTNSQTQPVPTSSVPVPTSDLNIDTSQPTTVIIKTPDGFPSASVPDDAPAPTITSTPQPTNTPWPVLPPATPQPTRCVYTVNGAQHVCPPTPQP